MCVCVYRIRHQTALQFLLRAELKRYQSHVPNFANGSIRSPPRPELPRRREAAARSAAARNNAGRDFVRPSAPARRHVRRLHVCGREVHVRLRENMLEPQDGGKVGVGAHDAGLREGAAPRERTARPAAQ